MIDGQETRRSADIAACLKEKGFEPIPLKYGQKYPTIKDWVNADVTQLVKNWPANHGIGIRTGNAVVGVDLDIYDIDITSMLRETARGYCGNILSRVGAPPKVLIPAYCPEIASKIMSNKWVDEQGVINQIEVLSQGQQFVAYGIHPDTKKPYQWYGGDLLSHSIPTFTKSQIHDLFDQFDKLAAKKRWKNLSSLEKEVSVVAAARKPTNTGYQPGDIYNRACRIQDVLGEYGWKHYRGNRWTRPNKKTGVSGSVFNDEVFWCFTSSTCLEPGKLYDSFGLLAAYEYNNDFSACARALASVMKEAV